MEAGTWVPGPAPDHSDYVPLADFAGPDGNLWLLQGGRMERAQSDRDRPAVPWPASER
jgi:hypothetical protein